MWAFSRKEVPTNRKVLQYNGYLQASNKTKALAFILEDGVSGGRTWIFGDTKPTTTPPLKPPWTDTSAHTCELTEQKTGDTASNDEIAMQMVDKDWDSYDATIYTDGAATHSNGNGGSGIVVTPLAPHVTLQSTVSAPYRPANGAHPSKPKRKLSERPSYLYRRMSPSTRCASFQIVRQHPKAYKICIHPSKLPTLMKKDS